MPNCGQGNCSCFASGCGYVGEDFEVHGCDSICCRGKCPGQTGQGKHLAYKTRESNKYALTLAAVLVFLVLVSTLFL